MNMANTATQTLPWCNRRRRLLSLCRLRIPRARTTEVKRVIKEIKRVIKEKAKAKIKDMERIER